MVFNTIEAQINEVQQAQSTKDEKEYEKDGGTQNSHDGLLPNVKAYKLFF
jgi:hypothetical protein